ncbi:coniferyl aldehyde dehydrogenase [Erythrobacteraceae bacterium CFH 75059]|nr:coniferyl aldehyde dehydrogenase [Qipengyuania thermophila]TCD05304.1 coniferyl aldehyde dehydrogenase [Erythrobacteraceae bacterium CFH 75059]
MSGEAARMQHVLERQRGAFVASRPERLAVRRNRIERAVRLLKDHAEALCAAMAEDFGSRSQRQSMMTDIAGTVRFGKYCLKHLEGWAKPSRRSLDFPLPLLGARAEVRYEPKGVVGILSPWNFPVNLSFGPLMQVLAAGNRAMLKPSEFTERTSELLRQLVERTFAEEEVAVITGGPDVAQAFSELPFDHLVFTGSTQTGRKVMEAAARNLVPVTLELGGKSPVVVGRSADLAKAGERIALGKMMNAGQICLAPDYLLVHESQEDAMVAAVELGARTLYPTVLANDDYASIVTDRHHQRLQDLVEDARDKGAEVVVVNPADEDFANSNARKMPLTILRKVTDDMRAMQEEIFGPVLPVKTYSRTEEAIDHINANDRPLGLYYFGNDRAEQEVVLGRTASGGVTTNDVLFHVSMDDLPFGGTGASGIGSYHGPEGFREFSHARSIYHQARVDVAKLAGFKPPYGPATDRTVRMTMK